MRGHYKSLLFCYLLTHFAQQLPNQKCRRPVRKHAHPRVRASPSALKRLVELPQEAGGGLTSFALIRATRDLADRLISPLSSLLNSALPSVLPPSPALHGGTPSMKGQAAGERLIISHFHTIRTLSHLYNCNSPHIFILSHTHTHN